MTSAQMTRLDQLDTRIRSVWGRGVTLHLIAGLLAFLRWAIPLFLIGVFIDWMTYMPTPGRVVILTTLLTVSCYRAWRCGWCHLRSFDVRRSALLATAATRAIGGQTAEDKADVKVGSLTRNIPEETKDAYNLAHSGAALGLVATIAMSHSKGSTWRFGPGRPSRCWAPAVAASPPSCAPSPASSGSTRAASVSAMDSNPTTPWASPSSSPACCPG